MQLKVQSIFNTNSAEGVAELTTYGPGQADMQIWMDDLDCDGSETSLAECGHDGWGQSNCDHDEDVSVSCGTPRKNFFLFLPLNVQIA